MDFSRKTVEEENQYQSRTQKKKQAEALQKLGLKLTRLSIPQLENVALPEKLKTALIEEKSITSNVAGRRQRQYIGALMRDIDPDVIESALLQTQDDVANESESLNAGQIWVERLLTGDSGTIEDLLHEYPGLERQRIRQLVRGINKEAKKAKRLKLKATFETIILEEMDHKKHSY
jgi:ribosome-associated protein